jgi:hypothetical protein
MSTSEEWREVLARSRELLSQPVPAAERKAAPDRSASSARRNITGVIYKRRDDALITSAKPEVAKGDPVSNDDDLSDLPAKASAYATANTPASAPWHRWVERHCEYRMNFMREVISGVISELQADAHDAADAVKRDFELMRRELTALREETKLQQELRDLRSEVEEARQQVPKFPAIASRLEAEQSRLQGELNATKNRMRPNASIAEYGISKLREQAWAASRKAASVEMELTKSSRFTMRNIDPAAAEALRDFAAQIVNARDKGGWIFPAGTA